MLIQRLLVMYLHVCILSENVKTFTCKFQLLFLLGVVYSSHHVVLLMQSSQAPVCDCPPDPANFSDTFQLRLPDRFQDR